MFGIVRGRLHLRARATRRRSQIPGFARLAELRSDKRRAVNELARVWARHADWRLMTSWRPRARMCAEVGSSRDPSRPLSITAYQGPEPFPAMTPHRKWEKI